MRWVKFADELPPKDYDQIIVRSADSKQTLPFRVSYSTKFLWAHLTFYSNTYPMDKYYYEWLDERPVQQCGECGRPK